MSLLTSLPEGCIARIVSFTSPKDACTMAAVSSLSKLIADSDTVWEQFLPPGYEEKISESDSPVELATKKQLYKRLCHYGLLMDGGRLNFRFSKISGKKCYLICAKTLYILWGSNPQYWIWQSLPESKFSEVAELLEVWWFDILGTFPSDLLSPNTTYAAYLVYKIKEDYSYWSGNYVHVKIECAGVGTIDTRLDNARRAYLGTPTHGSLYVGDVKAQGRPDGWMEIELGKFFVAQGNKFFIVCRLFEHVRLDRKTGLIVEGIEIRPKEAF